MDWIRSSWAMGRQWHILGGPGKAPEEFNLVFLFLPTFSFRSSVSMSLEECCTYSQSAGQEGSRTIRLSLPRGTFWALPVASWGDTCSMFIAFPQQKWTELCEGHATPAAEIPWRLALLFLVKFRSTTEEHLEAWDVRNGVISLGHQNLGQGEEDSIDTWHSGSGCRTQLPRDKILAIEQK